MSVSTLGTMPPATRREASTARASRTVRREMTLRGIRGIPQQAGHGRQLMSLAACRSRASTEATVSALMLRTLPSASAPSEETTGT